LDGGDDVLIDSPMTSHAILALYWRARPFGPSESAALLLRAFQALATAGFTTFYRKGRSAKDARKHQLIPSLEALTDMLTMSTNRRDVGGSAIPELGQSFGLWSGDREGEAYAVSGTIGSSSQHARNCFLMNFPPVGEHALPGASARVIGLFDALVGILDPDEAIICNVNSLAWDGPKLSKDIPCLSRYSRN
jgi:hypothetical protein